MNNYAFVAGLALSTVAIASACGSEVSTGNVPVLDQRCYERCIAEGGTDERCTEECTTIVDSGSGANGSGANSSGTNGSGANGSGGLEEGLVERQCFKCLEDNASACPAEHTVCEEDLACTVLKKCPFECLDDEQCVQQCKEIIPNGVPLMTDLIECMVCNGPPCQQDCLNSVMYDFCQ